MEDSLETAKLFGIKEICRMSTEEFSERYSGKTPPPSHFSDKIGYFCTNEYDYPESLNKIKVRGGIHLAVMGGVDPVLGQIAVAKPDLTIMGDVNTESLKTTTEGRVKPITESHNGIEYWNRVKIFFRNVVKKIDPKRQDYPSDSDISSGGWSSPENFEIVKESVENGKLKWIAGDITTDGIKVAFDLAKQTRIPIRLIYVSNIFDYRENSRNNFIGKLDQGIKEGLVDPNTQVIDTSLGEGVNTQVLGISSYLQLKDR